MLLTTSILLTQLKWERCRMRTKCECRRCVNRDAEQSNNSCVPVPVQRMEIKLIEDSKQLMPAGFLFQQDGAPAHTACVTQERLHANCPEIIEFVHRVHCHSLLIQIVPWIHSPRTEKSIPPDPSSFL